MGVHVKILSMLSHVQIYHDFFHIDPHNPRRCELTGRTTFTELHHIDARGMGGRASMDYIENIMCLTREAHIFFGDIVKYKEWLKVAHEMYMKDGMPWVHRGIESDFMDEFMDQYAPGKRKVLVNPYTKLSMSDIHGYLYGCLAPIAEYYLHDVCGYMEVTSKEHAIKFLKIQNGFTEIKVENGREIESPKSTGDYNNYNEIVNFVQSVYIFLFENDQNPPPPDRNWKNKIKNG